MAAAAAATAAPIIVEFAKMASEGIGSGLLGKKTREQQAKQFNRQQREVEVQNAWARQWGDVLNKISAQQGQQAITKNNMDLKMQNLNTKIETNRMQSELNAAKNFTVGRVQAQRMVNNVGSRQNAVNSMRLGA